MKKDTFWSRHFTTEAGFNLSWSSVIAGVVTFFAVFFMFSLLTSAVGFGLLSPTSNNPTGGVGIGVAIFTAIALIVSLFAGGFVAGLAARRTGMLHGFLTWALSMILMVIMLTSTVFGTVSTLGQIAGQTLGFVGKTAASASGAVADVAGKGLSALGDQISSQIGDVDTKEMQENMKQVLRDTDTPELQPEYLQGQLDQAKNELVEAAKQIAMNPKNADQEIQNVADKLQDRAEHIYANVDKDAIKAAVAKNTELSQAEADKAVDNIYNQIQEAKQEAQKQIENGKQALIDAKVQFEQTVDSTIEQGKQVAETATNVASTASIIMFIALLLGLVLTSFAGYVGSQKVKDQAVAQL